MIDKFFLIVSTPEKQFFSGMVESLEMSTSVGLMGILPSHKPMVVVMETAPIRMHSEEGWLVAAVSGGFAQIKNDSVVILADTAEWPDEIEVNRALEAKRRAEEKLQSRLSEIEFLQTQVALQRALTRLEITSGK